ncbi:zinc ribbon domain-containing protein [Kitasatospora sp. NBC_00039]|uniref:zinc ribbon domain-containing protein n=1 Tax=Kitasatospora sp. NBC_00039 TaxID=2903565 RepID=UPI0032436D38
MAQQNPAPGGGPNWGARPPASGPAKAHRRRFPRWRIFTWVILAFNLIMLIWIITGVSSTAKNCKGLTGEALTNCQANNVGTGIGATLILVVWALGDVILGVLWLITKPHKRYCPACGNGVRRGVLHCENCGYDFQQMLQQSQSGRGQPGPPAPPQWKQPPR